jgi:hypothetical protein
MSAEHDRAARAELVRALEQIAIAAHAVGRARPGSQALGAALVEASRLVADIFDDLTPEEIPEADPEGPDPGVGDRSPLRPLTSIRAS